MRAKRAPSTRARFARNAQRRGVREPTKNKETTKDNIQTIVKTIHQIILIRMLNTPPKTILKAMLEATDDTKYTAKDNS